MRLKIISIWTIVFLVLIPGLTAAQEETSIMKKNIFLEKSEVQSGVILDIECPFNDVSYMPPLKMKPDAEKFFSQSELKTSSTAESAKKKILTLGVGGGLYFIQDADFQDVYGKSTGYFGGEMNFFIPIKSREGIALAVDVKSISASGLSTETEEEVKLKLLPISFAVLYMRHYSRLVPFVGLGGSIFSYEETYPPSFAIPSTKGSTFGLNLQLGTYIKIVESLSLKVFFKFYDARTKENDLNINLGGNEYGIGIAYHIKL